MSERGTLIYNGSTEEASSDFLAQGLCKGGVLLEID